MPPSLESSSRELKLRGKLQQEDWSVISKWIKAIVEMAKNNSKNNRQKFVDLKVTVNLRAFIFRSTDKIWNTIIGQKIFVFCNFFVFCFCFCFVAKFRVFQKLEMDTMIKKITTNFRVKMLTNDFFVNFRKIWINARKDNKNNISSKCS